MPNNLGISDEEFEAQFDKEINPDDIPEYKPKKKNWADLTPEEKNRARRRAIGYAIRDANSKGY